MCIWPSPYIYKHTDITSNTYRILDQSLNCAYKQQTWQKWKCVFSFRRSHWLRPCVSVSVHTLNELISLMYTRNGVRVSERERIALCIALDGFPFYFDIMRTMPTKRVILIAAAATTLNLSERLHLKAKIQSEKRWRERKNAVWEISLYFSRREVNCTTFSCWLCVCVFFSSFTRHFISFRIRIVHSVHSLFLLILLPCVFYQMTTTFAQWAVCYNANESWLKKKSTNHQKISWEVKDTQIYGKKRKMRRSQSHGLDDFARIVARYDSNTYTQYSCHAIYSIHLLLNANSNNKSHQIPDFSIHP